VTAGTGDDVVTVSGSDSEIDGGAGNDTLTGLDGDQTIKGGFGNDTITDRGGADVLWGGLGNDLLSARDGTRDSLLCESGKDRAIADWLDYVWKCEKYKRGDTTPPGAFAATTKVKKLSTVERKTRNGFFPLVHVPVSCPAGASAGCAVTLSVYFRSERRGDVPFRHDPIVIPGGATRTVDLLGESFGLEAAFRGGARIPTLIAIVTTDDRLRTKTTLHPVVMKGTNTRG
jgi:hypothetical protein